MNLCIIFIFSFVCCNEGTGSDSFTYVIPKKLENEDTWTWGYTEISVPNRINTDDEEKSIGKTTSLTVGTKQDDSPCLPYNPPKPDFKAPGRRISETKCLEYQWEVDKEIILRNRESDCTKLRFKGLLLQPVGHTVGGRNTYPGEFPHMGAIGWKAVIGTWKFKCGSTLISPQFVLTAAHCSSAPKTDTTLADVIPKIVRLNAKNIIHFADENSTPNDINIVRIIQHPKYESPVKYYDIALMKLEQEVGFTRQLQPACLWPKEDLSELGSNATLTGWGVLKPGSLALSEELQAAAVDIIDSKTCGELLENHCNRNWCELMDHQLCAGKLAGGVDACQGDSGGPLQVPIPLADVNSFYKLYYIIGVTSSGIGCAESDRPGIYTRVSSFIDWIESEVWP